MNSLQKLPAQLQIVLGAGVLYLVFSFLDWQQISILGFTAGADEWHGVGVISGLLIFALLGWEVARLLGAGFPQGTALSDGLVSVGLALLLGLFTVITFLTHGTARHWPAWIGLILAIVIAIAALDRARGEGVQLPEVNAG